MKPIIGITVDCERDPSDHRTGGILKLNWNYAQVVVDHGGIPLLIPPMADPVAVAALIDGWLIPGGDDIDPKHYGQELHEKAKLQDPARYEMDAALYACIPDDLPIFGICYGSQFLNVVRGGSLNQHLEGYESHTSGVAEVYEVEPESKLSEIAGDLPLAGKTFHHQGMDRVGENLRVTARAHDGTIEALEATDRSWLVGVQWHPERTPEDEATQRIFDRFIAEARKFAEGKNK